MFSWFFSGMFFPYFGTSNGYRPSTKDKTTSKDVNKDKDKDTDGPWYTAYGFFGRKHILSSAPTAASSLTATGTDDMFVIRAAVGTIATSVIGKDEDNTFTYTGDTAIGSGLSVTHVPDVSFIGKNGVNADNVLTAAQNMAQFGDGVTSLTVRNSGVSSFGNLASSTTELAVKGFTDSGTDYFAYAAGPADHTVSLSLSWNAGKGQTINISSVGANDIRTLEIIGDGVSGSKTNPLTLTADGVDVANTQEGSSQFSTHTLKQTGLTTIKISGHWGSVLYLKDGNGTSDYTTLDASKHSGVLTFTETKDHSATILGGTGELNYISAHTSTTTTGQTFQFGSLGVAKAGSMAEVRTVGKINVSNVAAPAADVNLVDVFNLSTSIFGISSTDFTSKAVVHLGSGAAKADSYLYTQAAGATSTAALDLSSGQSYNLAGSDYKGTAHGAIVVVQDSKVANQLDIYYTDNHTAFGRGHAVLIGTYTEKDASSVAFDLDNFHIV